jgi:hypothetical protein
LLRCLEVRARLRELVEGSREDGLFPLCGFWALSCHVSFFPTTQAKIFSHTLYAFIGGEYLNGDGGVELHGNWSWPKRAIILLIVVESGTFGRFNSFRISHEGFERCAIGGAQFGPYVRFKTACVTINLFVETDVGDVENDFEKVCVVLWDIPELTPATKFISLKFDLVQGAETL